MYNLFIVSHLALAEFQRSLINNGRCHWSLIWSDGDNISYEYTQIWYFGSLPRHLNPATQINHNKFMVTGGKICIICFINFRNVS